MIVLNLWRLSHLDAPGYASHGTLAECEGWRDSRSWNTLGELAQERFVLERKPACGCCGRHYLTGRLSDSITSYANGAVRCADHHGRNPCAIEGCKRTRAAPTYSGGTLVGEPYHADDQTLCAEHWRLYVPPRSRLRRTYHSYFARAKRSGWGKTGTGGGGARLDWRFRRFWDALVAQARRRATEGFVDEAAINRIMGWE